MHQQVSRFYDSIAPGYDQVMGTGFITGLISQCFQEQLLEQFAHAQKVLDIGCGSGTDAVFLGKNGIHVHGFDISGGMIEAAVQKAKDAHAEDLITFSVSDAGDLSHFEEKGYDGACSNFNALNHLDDLEVFAEELSRKLQPGSPLVITMMNRICLSEILGYCLRFRFLTAARKLWSREKTMTIPMHLYSPGETADIFNPWFNRQSINGFGLLVPPAQLYSGGRFRSFFRILAAIERPILRWMPACYFCDIYILVLKRK